jgi:hypothetical protein
MSSIPRSQGYGSAILVVRRELLALAVGAFVAGCAGEDARTAGSAATPAGGGATPAPTGATTPKGAPSVTPPAPAAVASSSGASSDTGGPQIRQGDVTFEPQPLDGGTGTAWLCRGNDGVPRAQVVSFDNGPDDLSEGLRRYVADGKWGYVDAHCHVAIPAAWEFVEPFKNGHGRVCKGCIFVRDGEHTSTKGGQWSVVDRAGHAAP